MISRRLKIAKHLAGLFCTLLLLSFIIINRKPFIAAPKINAKPVISANLKPVVKPVISAKELLEKYIDNIYKSAHLNVSGLDFNVFKKGVTGFINLKIEKRIPQSTSILTLIDFNKSSSEKRMWIIDVMKKNLLLKTWVAHGQASGSDLARHFSDKIDSHASSIGFYLTDNVYYGKNGRSLRLDGLDAKFNIHAREREIVVHGADYVGPGAIRHTGHLGRSFGCPAVSHKVANRVINTIKQKTVMFINGNAKLYTSSFLNEQQAASFMK